MKTVLMTALLMLGSVAMAEEAATAPAAAPAAATKVSRKDAKAECLKGDKSLKGKKLNECIKEKMAAK